MSDQAAVGSRSEWPLEQRGRNSGAVRAGGGMAPMRSSLPNWMTGVSPASAGRVSPAMVVTGPWPPPGMLTLDCEPCGRPWPLPAEDAGRGLWTPGRASRHTPCPRIQGRMP